MSNLKIEHDSAKTIILYQQLDMVEWCILGENSNILYKFIYRSNIVNMLFPNNIIFVIVYLEH